jgi:hypothetical protein
MKKCVANMLAFHNFSKPETRNQIERKQIGPWVVS